VNGISDDTPGLFGWVPEPQRGQGRPGFVWTREKSNKVMVLFASKYKVAEVAKIIGCDAKTLRKVFSREVAYRDRAELVIRSGMMARLVTEAEAGNVGAMKQLDRMIEAEQRRAQSAKLEGKAPTRTLSVRLGKKDQANADAREVGGKYAPSAPPSLLVN